MSTIFLSCLKHHVSFLLLFFLLITHIFFAFFNIMLLRVFFLFCTLCIDCCLLMTIYSIIVFLFLLLYFYFSDNYYDIRLSPLLLLKYSAKYSLSFAYFIAFVSVFHNFGVFPCIFCYWLLEFSSSFQCRISFCLFSQLCRFSFSIYLICFLFFRLILCHVNPSVFLNFFLFIFVFHNFFFILTKVIILSFVFLKPSRCGIQNFWNLITKIIQHPASAIYYRNNYCLC